jgi:hypothetical protein
MNTSCCLKRAVEGLCWARKKYAKERIIRVLRLVLVDKERIKINERTLYARPLSLVLRDAVSVVSGKRLLSLRTRGGRHKGGENPFICCSS